MVVVIIPIQGDFILKYSPILQVNLYRTLVSFRAGGFWLYFFGKNYIVHGVDFFKGNYFLIVKVNKPNNQLRLIRFQIPTPTYETAKDLNYQDSLTSIPIPDYFHGRISMFTQSSDGHNNGKLYRNNR